MASQRLASSLRLLSQQASSSSTSLSLASASHARTIYMTASTSAAAKRATPAKKKIAVKKKAGSSGARSSSGRRKGGADSSASLSKNTEFHVELPDMSHLPLLHSENLTPSSVGQTFAFNERTMAAFKAFGLPQELEREFATQPKPRTLVRQQTLDLLDKLDEVSKGGKSAKFLLDGRSGSGKSTLLAQSIAYALDEGFVVIHVPRAINLINSSSLYTYSPQHMAYLQPEATKALLESISKVNEAALKGIKTTEKVEVEGLELSAGSGLDVVCKRATEGSASPATRQTLLEVVIKTLAGQSDKSVLVAVDDVQSLFRTSLYKDPDFVPLESYELALPRTLLSLLTSPSSSFNLKKGVFLGALSTSHSEFPSPPELQIALAEKASSTVVTQAVNAYTRFSAKHLEHAKQAVQSLSVIDTSKPLSRQEAAALFAQLKEERRHWSPVNDELFMSKFVESNGNARVFSRSLISTLL